MFAADQEAQVNPFSSTECEIWKWVSSDLTALSHMATLSVRGWE